MRIWTPDQRCWEESQGDHLGILLNRMSLWQVVFLNTYYKSLSDYFALWKTFCYSWNKFVIGADRLYHNITILKTSPLIHVIIYFVTWLLSLSYNVFKIFSNLTTVRLTNAKQHKRWRNASNYVPIEDQMFGINEEQTELRNF